MQARPGVDQAIETVLAEKVHAPLRARPQPTNGHGRAPPRPRSASPNGFEIRAGTHGCERTANPSAALTWFLATKDPGLTTRGGSGRIDRPWAGLSRRRKRASERFSGSSPGAGSSPALRPAPTAGTRDRLRRSERSSERSLASHRSQEAKKRVTGDCLVIRRRESWWSNPHGRSASQADSRAECRLRGRSADVECRLPARSWCEADHVRLVGCRADQRAEAQTTDAWRLPPSDVGKFRLPHRSTKTNRSSGPPGILGSASSCRA
ncbi:hypothetical protein ACVIM8_003975 [Bradyrhizobium sp. USDA 4529]